MILDVIEWEHRNRAILPHLLEAQARGRRITALEQRPRLSEHLHLVAQAAQDLAGDRGMAGTYPFVAVQAWCQAVGFSDPFWLLDRLTVWCEGLSDANPGEAGGI